VFCTRDVHGLVGKPAVQKQLARTWSWWRIILNGHGRVLTRFIWLRTERNVGSCIQVLILRVS
jgi:hypothetical protein